MSNIFQKILGGAAIAGAVGAVAAAVGKSPNYKSTKLFGGPLTFPSNLDQNYYMDLKFFAYSRQSPMAIGSLVPLDTIRLPIPASLNDTFSITYGEEEIGTSLGGAAEALTGTETQGMASALGAIGAAITGGASEAAKKLGLGAAVSAFTGTTANPFMTVLFKSPVYKTYSFTWRLFPRNSSEAQTILNIIQTVKYHALPDAIGSLGGAVLSYPSLAMLNIYAKKELYPFKYAVIENCTFNYAPDGAPSFYKDGSPTAVELRISFKEVEYFLKSNMGQSPRVG
jgi:hypothetical protein